MRKVSLLLIIFQLLFSTLSAREIAITGTVIDSVTHNGIPNVNVYLSGMTIGTVTDQNGNFKININESMSQAELIFQHIAYKLESVPLSELKDHVEIILCKKNIQLEKIEVESNLITYDYSQDIANIISSIPSKTFELKGFIDAADILMSDQSTIVDESLNGRKTVSIRGANEDEVLVLYDGIPINSNFDNLFDLSLIDPYSLQQIDIIKGGNVATSGSYGSSAVINFIPKLEQDYLLRFHQRVGTYNSGDWGLNFFKDLNGFRLFSGIKESGSTQRYVESQENETDITHESSNKMLNISYNFGKRINGEKRNMLSLNYIITNRDYDNQRDTEKLSMLNEIQSLKYSRGFGNFGDMKMIISKHTLNESHLWNAFNSSAGRQVDDNTLQFNAEYKLQLSDISFFLNYKHDDSHLDYQEKKVDEYQQPIAPEIYPFQRKRDGYSAAVQFKNTIPLYSFYLDNVQVNFSNEHVKDQQPSSFYSENMDGINNSKWRESSYMLSASFLGEEDIFLINSYFNYSANFKIPTLYQQITSILYPINTNPGDKLLMEYKENYEIGFMLFSNYKEILSVPQSKISGAIFRNVYRNKFRMIHLGGSPITFFDNYADASIFGTEADASIFIFNKMCTFNLSYSRYYMSDKAAFPFKSDKKFTSSISLDFKGFNLDLAFYSEAELVGCIVDHFGDNRELVLKELVLPEFSNIDLHISKSFDFWRLNCLASFSGRNLIKRELILEGIAIRDRRFYLTLGIEYE